jgi:predicted ribosomally synthesized peptide with nif11-like leader
MKTLQEFYEEVKTSDDLKKSLAEAVKAGKVTEFLKANGCDATADELKEFVVVKAAQDKPMREISEEELEHVAGGGGFDSATCTCNTDCCDKGDCC